MQGERNDQCDFKVQRLKKSLLSNENGKETN